jgi:hypothetical protein
MFETISTLAVEHPAFVMFAVVMALYPISKVWDSIFGQANNGGFEELKETKVKRFYFYTGGVVVLGALGALARDAGVAAMLF